MSTAGLLAGIASAGGCGRVERRREQRVGVLAPPSPQSLSGVDVAALVGRARRRCRQFDGRAAAAADCVLRGDDRALDA